MPDGVYTAMHGMHAAERNLVVDGRSTQTRVDPNYSRQVEVGRASRGTLAAQGAPLDRAENKSPAELIE